jgi:aminoglycoside 3-N-acetyltransferase
MPEQAVDRLSEDWSRSGIASGDMILIHSSCLRLIRRMKAAGFRVGVDGIIDSLLRAVGPEGTLLFPLFNFDFAGGVPFDMRSTPSRMGALTEAARKRPDAVRTGHPIYSFAVLGARRALFDGLVNHSGYGADSPFGILHREGGKIGILDLPDQNSMTFYHYVEEAHAAPYRYHKSFTGAYTDARGETSDKTFGLFVRDIDKGVLTDVDPMGERLWQKGLYAGSRPGVDEGLRVIEAGRLYDEVSEVIVSGKAEGLLFSYEGR